MLNSKVYTKKCVICGKEYKSISVRALTCGKDCRNEYRRRKDREKRSVKTCFRKSKRSRHELRKICGNDGRYTEDLAGRGIKYWRIVAYEVFKTD